MRKIVYLGPTTAGSVHDKKMADTEQIRYPLATLLFQDTGFQGYSPEGVSIQQPKKKPKGKELSVGERFLNAALSSFRIVVEHCISGAKRARIVKEVFRNTKYGFSDLVMEVACALHNLRVEFRYAPPHLDLRELAMESYSR
jgi:DDE superfamily endonuclease